MAEFYQVAELPKEKKIEVINYVTSQKEIRTSELQRKFLWGYHRAGHTMDWLYSLGIVSEFNGLTYRNVIMSNESAQKVIEGLS